MTISAYLEYKDRCSANSSEVTNVLLYRLWQLSLNGTGSGGGISTTTSELIKEIADTLEQRVVRVSRDAALIPLTYSMILPSTPTRQSLFIQNPVNYIVPITLVARTSNLSISQPGLQAGDYYLADLLPGQAYYESLPTPIITHAIFGIVNSSSVQTLSSETQASLVPIAWEGVA